MYKRQWQILAALRRSKHAGMTVKELSESIGYSQTVIRKWLYPLVGTNDTSVKILPNSSPKVYLHCAYVRRDGYADIDKE